MPVLLPAPAVKSDPSPSPVSENHFESGPSLLTLGQRLRFETPSKWDGHLATVHDFTENYREHFTKHIRYNFSYATFRPALQVSG